MRRRNGGGGVSIRRTCAVVGIVGVLAAVGCATPPRMRLSRQTPTRTGEAVWWVVRDPGGLHGPVLGIERRTGRGVSQQVLFSDRGVRRFTYTGGRLTDRGPPLGGTDAGRNIAVVRGVLWRFRRTGALGDSVGSSDRAAVASDGRAATLAVIPSAAIDGVGSAEDAVAVLERFWITGRVEAAVGLSYREINAELEGFAHGVFELIAASKAFRSR